MFWRGGRPALCGLMLLVLLAHSARPPEVPAQALPPNRGTAADSEWQDYDFNEFPQWAWDLRRFEVIAVGAFPVAYFATSLIYDYTLFGMNNFDPAYSLGTQRDANDIAIIAGTAAGVALTVALTDLIIELVQRKKREKGKEPHEEAELPRPSP